MSYERKPSSSRNPQLPAGFTTGKSAATRQWAAEHNVPVEDTGDPAANYELWRQHFAQSIGLPEADVTVNAGSHYASVNIWHTTPQLSVEGVFSVLPGTAGQVHARPASKPRLELHILDGNIAAYEDILRYAVARLQQSAKEESEHAA